MGLNLKEEVVTRMGHEVKVYECYKDYCNGAWLDWETNRWIPITWTMPNGFSWAPKHYPLRQLDLVNDEPYKE